MKQWILFLSLLMGTCELFGQKTYDIDLAKAIPGESTIGLNYTGVKLINKCPNKSYKFKITVEKEYTSNFGNTAGTDSWKEDTTLKKLVEAYNGLNNAEKEADVPKLKDALIAEYKKISNTHTHYKAVTEAKDAILAQTTQTIAFDFDPEKDQNIHVWIYRVDKEKVTNTWYQILRTPRTAHYISHFGFTFSPNWIKGPDNYFSKANGKSAVEDVDSFTITKLNANGKEFWKDLSITANFLIPLKFRKRSTDPELRMAWMGGFGVGGDARFTVFSGPSFLFKDFTAIGIAFGVHSVHKLKGEYQPGQGIKENLNFDQLHTRGIRPTILLSWSFRLSRKQLENGEVENVGGAE